MQPRWMRLPIATALLLAGFDAAAICPITPQLFVGDTASDSACSYDDIQSALNAANNTGALCPTIVHVTRMHTWTSQHLSIVGKQLTVQGWGDGVTCSSILAQCDVFTGCPQPASTQPLVTIDGRDGSGSYTTGRVLTIYGGSDVTLRNVAIMGGRDGTGSGASIPLDGDGGGIYFGEAGTLSLTRSNVALNHAGYGGGIEVNGSGGDASLYLLDDTTVLNNIAGVSGGGVRLEGTARLFALRPQTWISFNQAQSGYGGGVELLGPARADIGSPGYNGAPVIEFNTADYGGGIAVYAGPNDGDSATARIFTTDANNPVQVSNNTASHTGGGVYLHPKVGGTGASLCAYDFRIDHNIAQEGTAVYADLDSNLSGSQEAGDVILNSDPYNVCAAPESPPALGAVACAPDVPCNTMNGNVAEDDSNTAKPGSVILVQNNGSLEADRLVMRGNQGAHAIRLIDPQIVEDNVRNCLLVDNQFSADLLYVQNGDYPFATHFSDCTIANNAIGSGSVLRSEIAVSLAGSIIDQPGVPTLNYTGNGNNLAVSYVLSNDTATLPVAPGVVQGEPDFVDAAGGDYHLQAASFGVDFAPAGGGHDLDRLPRDADLAIVPNQYGPRDIGAYERQSPFDGCGARDTLFCDGFGL